MLLTGLQLTLAPSGPTLTAAIACTAVHTCTCTHKAAQNVMAAQLHAASSLAQTRTEPADVTDPCSRNTRSSGAELRPHCGTSTAPRRHQPSVQSHALTRIETYRSGCGVAAHSKPYNNQIRPLPMIE